MVILQSAASQQHLNQENQCLRTGKCGNADLGQQTLGNDNSVTGFADQSKNVQNRVLAVTPTPTPTPTPTLTQSVSGLVIAKNCLSACPGVRFSITVTGNNPQPSSFTITRGQAVIVTLGPGSFTVTESVPTGFFPPRFAADCVQPDVAKPTAIGTIGAGQALLCIIANTRIE
jgi:hypothetical protein